MHLRHMEEIRLSSRFMRDLPIGHRDPPPCRVIGRAAQKQSLRRAAIRHAVELSRAGDTVIVAGKIRKWKGRLLDVDLPRLRQQLEASRDFIFAKAGVAQDVFH